MLKPLLLTGAIALMAQVPSLAGGPNFELTWFTIDGGGGASQSADGSIVLNGTIGQPDAGAMSGGPFELTGGFWFQTPPGDCEFDGDVGLFDYAVFEFCLMGPSGSAPDPTCACFDVDRSGVIDLSDFAIIQSTFTGD